MKEKPIYMCQIGNEILTMPIPETNDFIKLFDVEEKDNNYLISVKGGMGEIKIDILGLKDRLGYDLEILMPLCVGEVLRLIPSIIYNARVKNIVLKHNLITLNLTGAPIEIKIVDEVRKKARLIFSDEKYRLPSNEKCSFPFNKQYTFL